jgi:hypothetical protein
MKIATTDPNIFIIEQTPGRVVYETTTGEKWEILGTCIACGACEVGAVDKYYTEDPERPRQLIEHSYQEWTGVSVGQPGACLDSRFGTRPDLPVRPEISSHFPTCTLSGNYINGN